MMITDKSGIAAGGESGLYGECLVPVEKLTDTFQHEPSGVHGHFGRIERREAGRDLIGVDKFIHAEHIVEQGERCGSLPRTITSGYYIEL